MMEFSHIALLLSTAAIFGIIAKFLKQPLLIGYLFAGLFLSSLGLVHFSSDLESLSKIGVTLLLFLLGIEMKISDLSSVGKVALLTGIGQITFTSVIGYLLARILGFPGLPSLYVAIALTFSSTIIMVKLLAEKNDLSSLYGRISVGFLLVQDFVAILILMLLSGFVDTQVNITDYLFIVVRAVMLITVIWILSKKVLPRLFYKLLDDSNELLFIVSVAWALGLAALVAGPLGFTLEIGGFLAGIALSNLPEHLQIASRAKPLRDFFLTIFFLILGSQLVISDGVSHILIPAAIFSLFVLIGNPIIVLIIMGVLRYKRRTSFMSGLTVAQISEFSLILMAMGFALGHVSESQVATIILVGVVTMTVSTYMILGADKIYKKIENYLKVFERSKTFEGAYSQEIKLKDHVIIVGSDRTGTLLVDFFVKNNFEVIVVDFNPSVYKRLTAENIPVIFGDIDDPEIVEDTNYQKAKYIISTTSDLETDLTLIERINSLKNKPATIVLARSRTNAIRLYEKGATYVVVPDIATGEFIRHIFRMPGIGKKRFTKMGNAHFKRLTKT